MRRIIASAMALLLVVSCGGGSGSAPPGNPPPPPGAPTASETLSAALDGLTIDEVFETSYNAFALRSPETILWRGIGDFFPDLEPQLDDWSVEYRQETNRMYEVTLEHLQGVDRDSLTDEQKLNYDVYVAYLQDLVDRSEFFFHDFVATYAIFGVQSSTQRLFTDIHPLTSRQDAEDYITRLNQVARKFQQISDHLQAQRSAGVVEPQLTLDVAIFYMNGPADGAAATHPYYTAFSEKIEDIAELSDAERTQLRDDALMAVQTSVKPGYVNLRNTMRNLAANASPSIGVGQFSRGLAYYDYSLRRHTTTNLTAGQIHQLGLDELQRIHAEMRAVFDELGYPQNETLAQLFDRVADDGGIVPAVDALATFESIVEFSRQNLDEAFDIFPEADVVVIPDQFGGYYIAPSFDGSRPGAFYAGTSSQPYFGMPSLTYHEALPGHHLQLAILAEQDLPAFRKLNSVTAFTEGWALYAERLAYELGWYDGDPYGNLGRLQYEALRAARLVIDTGIHNLGWSFSQAVEFNMEALGASRGSSEGAAARYSVWPGQATAYLIGMLEILDARQRAMDQLGDQFDLKEFHRLLLEGGTMPLTLMNQRVDDYIADKLSGT